MKNKFLVLFVGILLVLVTTNSVMAYDINVPILVKIEGDMLTIQSDNLDWSYNLSKTYNLTANQTANVSYNTILISKLTEETAASIETLLRDMTVQCSYFYEYAEEYLNCSLAVSELNKTQDALFICQSENIACKTNLESWRTNAAAHAIANPHEIRVRFDEAKNSRMWLVIVALLVGIGGTYWFINKKGKGKRPKDIETADYD